MTPAPQSRVSAPPNDEETLHCGPTPSPTYKHKTVKSVKTVRGESYSYLATIFLLLFLASDNVFCSWIGIPPPSPPYERNIETFPSNNNNDNTNNSPAALHTEFQDFVSKAGRPQRFPSPFIRGRPSFPSPPSSPSSSSSFRVFPFASFPTSHNEVKEEKEEKEFESSLRMRSRFHQDGQGGCENPAGGFRFAGETWYSSGCRRNKCLHFRGRFFVETDSCDTEFYNTVYKCIVVADISANYPECCPRYECNPDNLGYSSK